MLIYPTTVHESGLIKQMPHSSPWQRTWRITDLFHTYVWYPLMNLWNGSKPLTFKATYSYQIQDKTEEETKRATVSPYERVDSHKMGIMLDSIAQSQPAPPGPKIVHIPALYAKNSTFSDACKALNAHITQATKELQPNTKALLVIPVTTPPPKYFGLFRIGKGHITLIAVPVKKEGEQLRRTAPYEYFDSKGLHPEDPANRMVEDQDHSKGALVQELIPEIEKLLDDKNSDAAIEVIHPDYQFQTDVHTCGLWVAAYAKARAENRSPFGTLDHLGGFKGKPDALLNYLSTLVQS